MVQAVTNRGSKCRPHGRIRDSQLGTHESAGLRNECVVTVAVAVAEAMAVGEHSPVDDGVSTDACYLDPRRIEVQVSLDDRPIGVGQRPVQCC